MKKKYTYKDVVHYWLDGRLQNMKLTPKHKDIMKELEKREIKIYNQALKDATDELLRNGNIRQANTLKKLFKGLK